MNEIIDLQIYFIKVTSSLLIYNTLHFCRPYNTLTLTGQFSISDVHTWLSLCLPDMPDKAPLEDSCVLMFESVLLHTQLSCDFKSGHLILKSDSISTIAIMKDVITKEATKSKYHLNVSYDLSDASIAHTLKLIYPLLEEQLMLARKIKVLQALRVGYYLLSGRVKLFSCFSTTGVQEDNLYTDFKNNNIEK